MEIIFPAKTAGEVTSMLISLAAAVVYNSEQLLGPLWFFTAALNRRFLLLSQLITHHTSHLFHV